MATLKNLRPGDVIGHKYRLEQLLGQGSMGSVWSARNQLTDRAFAIKFMLPDFAREPTLVQRFFNEAKICGRLDHPAIVETYDLGVADELEGAPFIVMELLRGEGLDTLLAREKRIDPRQVCPILIEIASALDHAHAAGIIHRDVKPSNIFLHRNREGQLVPKILDFGVSKIIEEQNNTSDITRVGALLGSPLYMSPEQARGQSDIDARTDVWALGVVLYEAISGKNPFTSSTYNGVLSAILTSRPRPLRDMVPGLPLALGDAVELCLVRDRNRRMATAAQLASRLESVLLSLAQPHDSDFATDDTTEIMSHEALRAILPGKDPADESAPLSRTSSLRRAILAELAPSVHTRQESSSSEPSIKTPSPPDSQNRPPLSIEQLIRSELPTLPTVLPTPEPLTRLDTPIPRAVRKVDDLREPAMLRAPVDPTPLPDAELSLEPVLETPTPPPPALLPSSPPDPQPLATLPDVEPATASGEPPPSSVDLTSDAQARRLAEATASAIRATREQILQRTGANTPASGDGTASNSAAKPTADKVEDRGADKPTDKATADKATTDEAPQAPIPQVAVAAPPGNGVWLAVAAALTLLAALAALALSFKR